MGVPREEGHFKEGSDELRGRVLMVGGTKSVTLSHVVSNKEA